MKLRSFFKIYSLLLLMSSSASLAQDTQDDWNNSCNPDTCTMSLSLYEQATDRRVATMLAVVTKGSDQINFGVALPLGTALDSGVRVLAGDTIIEIPFQVCFPDGCRALTGLTEDDLVALLSAETVDLRFFPYTSDKPVSLKTSIGDFSAKLDSARETLGN